MESTKEPAPHRDPPPRAVTMSGAAIAVFVVAELLCTALLIVLFL